MALEDSREYRGIKFPLERVDSGTGNLGQWWDHYLETEQKSEPPFFFPEISLRCYHIVVLSYSIRFYIVSFIQSSLPLNTYLRRGVGGGTEVKTRSNERNLEKSKLPKRILAQWNVHSKPRQWHNEIVTFQFSLSAAVRISNVLRVPSRNVFKRFRNELQRILEKSRTRVSLQIKLPPVPTLGVFVNRPASVTASSF